MFLVVNDHTRVRIHFVSKLCVNEGKTSESRFLKDAEIPYLNIEKWLRIPFFLFLACNNVNLATYNIRAAQKEILLNKGRTKTKQECSFGIHEAERLPAVLCKAKSISANNSFWHYYYCSE